MSDAIAFIRDSIDATTMGPEEKFVSFMADDIVMRFPYVPAGLSGEVQGLENVLKTFREVWKGFATFEWYDVTIRKVEGDIEVPAAHRRAAGVTADEHVRDVVEGTRAIVATLTPSR